MASPRIGSTAAFALILAAVILVSVQVMGVTLIAAALVIPASAARLLTQRFDHLLWLASGIGAGVSLLGMYASYYLDLASGAYDRVDRQPGSSWWHG